MGGARPEQLQQSRQTRGKGQGWRTLRKYWVEADCWKEMPTHSTRSATAMSSSMRSYTVSGVITWSAADRSPHQNLIHATSRIDSRNTGAWIKSTHLCCTVLLLSIPLSSSKAAGHSCVHPPLAWHHGSKI